MLYLGGPKQDISFIPFLKDSLWFLHRVPLIFKVTDHTLDGVDYGIIIQVNKAGY